MCGNVWTRPGHVASLVTVAVAVLPHCGTDGDAAVRGLRTPVCPLPPRRPLPGDPWEGPAPGWRGRTEVISRVRGRPQAIFVLPLQEPNSVIKRSRAPCLQFGPFPPPKAELDPILPPALPVSSPVEEWAAGGRRRWIKSFLFSESPGVWARGLGRPGAAGGGRGRGRGGGHLPARPGGGGRGRLLLGFLGAGRGRGGGERGGGGPGLRPRPPPPSCGADVTGLHCNPRSERDRDPRPNFAP